MAAKWVEDLHGFVDLLGGDAEKGVRVVESWVDLQGQAREAFDFTPLLEKPVAGGEQVAHARRPRRLSLELVVDGEGVNRIVGRHRLRKKPQVRLL